MFVSLEIKWNIGTELVATDLEKQSPRGVLSKSVLKNFAKFTIKHLCQSLFPNIVAGLRLINYSHVKLEKVGCDLGVCVLKLFPEVSTLSN